MTKLEKLMRINGLSKSKLAVSIRRNPNNLSDAWNGRCKWFPAWRHDISILLKAKESDLFDEYGFLKDADDESGSDYDNIGSNSTV